MKLDHFLSHICRNLGPDEVVVTVSADEGWKARRYRPGDQVSLNSLYFCISTVRNEPRKNVLPLTTDALMRTHVIVLDDIGTKVDPALIKLQPSYKLETSPGNFQWGYLLTYGSDPAKAAALIQGLIDAGMTDAGAGGAQRIVRVPGSVNSKPAALVNGAPFLARLVEEHWERTWTLFQLELLFGVLAADPKHTMDGPRALEAGETDPTFEWLLEGDEILAGPNARGFYDIECPWSSSHTDGRILAGYVPGRPGVFKCLHGHCQDKHTAQFKDWIREQDPNAVLEVTLADMVSGLAEQLAALRAPGAAPSPLAGLAERARAWREAQEPAPPRSVPVGPGSPAMRLAQHIADIDLRPGVLPDPAMVERGKHTVVSPKQPTSAARVHTVMHLIGLTPRLNMMTHHVEMTLEGWEEKTEGEDFAGLLVHACQRCGMGDQKTMRDAIETAAFINKYHPVLDWIDGAEWDGVDRIQAFADTIVMRDKALNGWRDAVVRRFLNQMYVALTNWERPEPTDVGYTMVLQGPQNMGKSRWVKYGVLPAGWVMGDMSLNLANNERDAVTRVTRTPLTELGEVDATFSKSDVAALKNFLTASKDVYRMAYGRGDVERPRCTVFIATVNPEDYLMDATGERRFWTLGIERCIWDHGIDLQQLWIQVACQEDHRYWLNDEETAMHAAVSAEHMADSDAQAIINALEIRRAGGARDDTWKHMTPRELCKAFVFKEHVRTSSDLNARLARSVWAQAAKIHGKRGWWVPNPYAIGTKHIETGMRRKDAGLEVVSGGKG